MVYGFRMTEHLQKPSVCPMDCPDTCSLRVTVENDRVTKVNGSRVNPITAGAVCSKVMKYYPDYIHGPDRLKQPLVRVGAKGDGQFEAVSWERALDTIYQRYSDIIASHGAQAIVPFNYAGPHGVLAGGSMATRFFNKLGASKLDRGPLCAGTRSLAYASLFGTTSGISPEEVIRSNTIVIWGRNITVSALHQTRLITQAQKNGVKLIVIDPKRIRIAEQADLYVGLRPGTDVILAYAVAAELERLDGLDHDFIKEWVEGFDPYMTEARTYTVEKAAAICGVDAMDIRALAQCFADGAPLSMTVGVGVERNRNGGGGIRAALSLLALSGNIGKVGSGFFDKFSLTFPMNREALERPDLTSGIPREFNIIDVVTHILEDKVDPPIMSLFIFNHNPIAVHPNQNRMKRALAKEDLFAVGCDVTMTESLAFADVILPAASHFEFDDLYPAYGHQYLQRAVPVIPAVGDALSNTEIFRRLAARFGFHDACFKTQDLDLITEALSIGDDRLPGPQSEQVSTTDAYPMQDDEGSLSLLRGLLPQTPSGKIELSSDRLQERYNAQVPKYRSLASEYPLTLVTPSSDRRINSTFGGSDPESALEVLEMHPDDAEPRGLTEGMTVRVHNDLGEVHLRLQITPVVRPGCVYSPKGAWLKTSPTHQTTNALIPGHKSDIADGACYNDARVEVEAIT